ncbi:Cadmium, cobalt and zinc/H(+)-K(+) antiporter [compost metagenome]
MSTHNHAGHAGHSHGHAHGGSQRALAITLVLVVAYMAAEVVGGLMANSLALIADAGHMLSDAAALALSLFAMWAARQPSSPQHTYGYVRTEILAALVNGATLVAISFYIFVEAYERWGQPPDVQGAWVMAIATGGLIVNLIGLRLLSGGKEENLNVRGAWLHVMTDMLGSIGAITAGALVWAFGWNWADPVVSVLIGILVLYSAWSLLKDTVGVLMEWAPGNVDVKKVQGTIEDVAGVERVYDLHVWTISSGKVALSARVVHDAQRPATELLEEIHNMLHQYFHINHVTVQLEPLGFDEKGCVP